MGLSRELFLRDPQDTEVLGETVGPALVGGEVIALSGPLGAGKTTFVRGLARGLKILDEHSVSSPTYTLLQEYPCARFTLFHLDLYRVEGEDDAESTGFRDLIDDPTAVTVVEWAEKVPGLLPEERWELDLSYPAEGSTKGGRVARISAFGRDLERHLEWVLGIWDRWERSRWKM